MLKVYDISMAIKPSMQVYKNKDEKRPTIEVMRDFKTSTAYESRISMDAHTGTHVDAPLHMIEGGATIETIALENFVSTARVLDFTHVLEGIGRVDLEPYGIQSGEWLLLKTRNSLSEEFDFEFVYLKEDGAQYLAEKHIKGVGTDGIGIERAQSNYGTHRTLLNNNIIIVEGLRLKEVPAGSYLMVIAPLKLEGIEAAPARALLIGA